MKKWIKINGLLLLTVLAGITANAQEPDTNLYTLSVYNGGVGTAINLTTGQLVTISVILSPDQAFDRWIGATQYVASVTSTTTTVTMPASTISVTATYLNLYYALTVINGTGDGSYIAGSNVTITANASPTNQAFDRWIGDTQVVANIASSTTTVTMPSNAVTLTATYTNLPGYYTLTVANGTGGERYASGTYVLITASNAPAGQAFDQWIGDTSELVDSVTSSTNTVIMSTNAVSLTATYTNLYGWNILKVGNGAGSGSYTNGARVTISADVEAGQAFKRWTGAVQYVAREDASPTIVTMPAWAITLTAEYEADTNLPTVKISTPNANARILATTGQFTVYGTASDNKTVTNVLVKLNNDGYVPAKTTDGWRTWSLPVTLKPGTNTILAYSVDLAVNSSLISTVKCTYAETTSFTILTIGAGKGTLSPSETPEVGKTYTLKASPENGSAFVDWTGYINSTNREIMFTMPLNKTVTANFIDIQKPTVSITYPTASMRVMTNGTVVIRGTAADNVKLKEVRYKLYTGEWTNAVTTNGWKNWTADFFPVTGLNTAQVYSVDMQGYVSANSTVVFTYVPGAVMQVQTTGAGTITPAYNGKVLEIGKSYTMTAAPKAGSVFTNWTSGIGGPVAKRKPDITFVMQSNLVLTANFRSLSAKVAKADIAVDMPATPQAAITVDGSAKDWANVPRSSFSYASVTQEVAVALNGNNIALLLKGCPFGTSDTVLVYFKLRLSYGIGDNRHSVDLWTSGSVLYGMVDGQVITGLEAVLLNGVLEVKLPVEQAPSQVTIEEVACRTDLGGGTLTELFKISPAGQ